MPAAEGDFVLNLFARPTQSTELRASHDLALGSLQLGYCVKATFSLRPTRWSTFALKAVGRTAAGKGEVVTERRVLGHAPSVVAMAAGAESLASTCGSTARPLALFITDSSG